MTSVQLTPPHTETLPERVLTGHTFVLSHFTLVLCPRYSPAYDYAGKWKV